MITASAYLALAAALAVTVAVTTLPHALHGLAPYLLAGLWAVALWAARRADARRASPRYYHRHRFQHAKCHARPTLARRTVRAARRVLSLRIRITISSKTRTA